MVGIRPEIPDELKELVAANHKSRKEAEDEKATLEARKMAQAFQYALMRGDAQEARKQYEDLRKIAQKGLAGHSFVKTVAQEVADADSGGGKGNFYGDMLIAEGFMQLMFGVDPKALRGSPQMTNQLLSNAGGWDDKAIAKINSALTGGKLDQDVRNQILAAAQRQVGSWDQYVIQNGQIVDNPKVKKLMESYMKATAQNGDLKDLGGVPIQ